MRFLFPAWLIQIVPAFLLAFPSSVSANDDKKPEQVSMVELIRKLASPDFKEREDAKRLLLDRKGGDVEKTSARYRPFEDNASCDYCRFNDHDDLTFGTDLYLLRGSFAKIVPARISNVYTTRVGSGDGKVGSVAVSADGETCAIGHGYGHVSVLDHKGTKKARLYWGTGDSPILAISGDGSLIAISGRGARVTTIHDIAGNKKIADVKTEWPVLSLAFHDQQPIIAIGGEGALQLWDTRRSKSICTLACAGKKVQRLVFAPGFSSFLGYTATEADGGEGAYTVHLVDWKNNKEVRNFLVAPTRRARPNKSVDGAYPIAISPDGHLLAVGGTGQPISLWEVVSGTRVCNLELRPVEGMVNYAQSLSFSRRGNKLASAANSGLRVWELPQAISDRLGSYDVEHRHPQDYVRALGDADARLAYRALLGWMSRPEKALAVIGKTFLPVSQEEHEETHRLIRELADDNFQVRKAATNKLVQKGEWVRGIVERECRSDRCSLEVRRRLELVLAQLSADSMDAKYLLLMRTVRLLEQIGCKEAEKLLARFVADGQQDCCYTLEAAAALDRLREAKNGGSGK